MKTLRNLARNLVVLGDLLSFFWVTRHWWLVPMLTMLALLATLIALAQTSAIGPFIYTLF